MTSNTNSIAAEYNEIIEKKSWPVVFQEIREKCDKEAKEKQFTVNESGKSENRCLNRYRDVNPYDHSRIIIHRGKNDYINANLVKLERADRKYILTQGPLKETVGHFWLMIWEQNTKAILMLNKIIEKNQIKCHMYWPANMIEDHILNLPDVGLSVEYLKCEEYTHFSKRTFRLADTESRKSREIIQFHYTTWPDFGIPSSPTTFLQFLKQVRDSGALDPDVGPAVVHCSAGIGRSGTFCLVDCCLVLIKKGENKVSVRDILYELRRYRMGLIQTADQLFFSYQAIIEGIKLLDDPTFLEYDEIPTIPTNEKSYNDQLYTDNTQQQQQQQQQPPPPPPTRIESLRLPPVPPVRSTVSLGFIPNNDEKTITTVGSGGITAEQYKNEKNSSNLTAIQQQQQYPSDRNSINGRPLPPLPPRPICLKESKESDEDSPLYGDDSDTEENSDYDDKYDSDNDIDQTNRNDPSKLIENSGNIEKIHDKSNTTTSTMDDKNITDNNDKIINNKIISNGVDRNQNRGSSDLRRRTGAHAERQANIEKKVNEIKRKQREIEAETDASKKRRSLVKFIAAGVIVGVLCVYAYTKFG